MKKVLSLTLLLLFFCFSLNYAQKSIDALSKAYQSAASKQDRVAQVELITDYYFRHRNHDSLIKYGKLAIELYQDLGNREQVARNQLMLSLVYLDKGDVANLEKYLNPSSAYFSDKRDTRRYARTKFLAGVLQQQKQQYKGAIDNFKEVIALYHSEKNKVDDHIALNAYNGLFGTYTLDQRFEEALKTSDKYFNFIVEHFPGETGSAHMQLGNLYNFTMDQKRAVAEFIKAKSFYQKQNNEAAIATINLQLGVALSGLDQNDSATIILKEAERYFQKTGNKNGQSAICYALSAIALKQKAYSKSERLIDEAISLSQPGNPLEVYYATQKGRISLTMLTDDTSGIKTNAIKNLQLKAAIKDFEQAFGQLAARKTGFVSPHELIEGHALLAKAHELLANYESAYINYKSSTTIKDSIFGTDKMLSFNSLESELNIEREKARIKLEEATKLLRLQKEMELEALRHDYERKQAAAKTEEERQRLIHEEELKRKEIEIKYDEEQKAVRLKYEQEKEIARLEQEKKDAIAGAELQSARNIRNLSALGVGLATLLLGITGWSYVQKRKDNKKIAFEKSKSDELLLNILPYEVAEELKEKGTTSAQLHDKVSVLFTDFVNFTANAEKIGVQELIEELNACFTAFDQIMERYGLEKIKTIGDAYLAVSGLPLANPQHAKNAVLAAKDILAFITARRASNATALEIRIGINSGPVVAGIVGVKKFAFDIWGDAVNTAARMEQNSKPGRINVSAATYELIKNEFNCEARGSIETKGKGAIEMYFVN